ncbi:MAG: DUF1844 domain-containing protein [Myxococcales bacterium]|nr:DUF1844 domain-containing protein [Myxococcales bacterium]MDH5305868.1 DUF1844 domain-containing protein [Myxococcales bacterium]MDH5566433.1 DUF1844 domain-containing protein [Myxococcales bacterium]
MTTEEGKTERGFTLRDDPARSGTAAESLPHIDFSTFVLSIASSGLYHMGLAPDPSGQSASEPNLPLARQTIETLEMLEEKTRGNLDADEAKLIQTVLYELRMDFVKLER